MKISKHNRSLIAAKRRELAVLYRECGCTFKQIGTEMNVGSQRARTMFEDGAREKKIGGYRPIGSTITAESMRRKFDRWGRKKKIYIVMSYKTGLTKSAWNFSFSAEIECNRLNEQYPKDHFVAEAFELRDDIKPKSSIIKAIERRIISVQKLKSDESEKEYLIETLNEQLSEIKNAIAKEKRK